MIPYTADARADTGVTNVTLGVWLFLASEVMLFGALFSSYALLRVAAGAAWPSGGDVLDVTLGAANTIVLLAGTALVWRARARQGSPRGLLLASAVLALVFLGIKSLEYSGEIARGLLPSTSTFLAMYFTLTGLHAAHVIGGVIANLWIAAGATRHPRLTAGRVRAVSLYWAFVDLIWLLVFALMYLT